MLQHPVPRAGEIFQQAPAGEQSLARELVEELFYTQAAPREQRSSLEEEVICLSDDKWEAKKISIDMRELGGEGRDRAGQHRVRVALLEELGRLGLVNNLVINFQQGFGVVSFGTIGAAEAAVVQGQVWVQVKELSTACLTAPRTVHNLQGVLVEMKRYEGSY